jgi:hypothetical protein
MSTVPSREIAEAYEETVAIEHLCKLVEENLLKPAPPQDIARAILAEMVPRFDDRLAKAMRTPGQHMAEHGLRAAVKAVRRES